jgi:hypothetical protein
VLQGGLDLAAEAGGIGPQDVPPPLDQRQAAGTGRFDHGGFAPGPQKKFGRDGIAQRTGAGHGNFPAAAGAVKRLDGAVAAVGRGDDIDRGRDAEAGESLSETRGHGRSGFD